MLVAAISLTVFGAITSLFIGLLSRGRGSAMESRIQDFRNRTASDYEDEVDLDLPFSARVVIPLMDGIARTAGSVLPQSMIADIQKQLAMAGHPITLNAFLIFWVVIAASFSGLGLLAAVTLPGDMLAQKVIAVLVLGTIGVFFPKFWLKGKVKSKQKMVVRALPDALDLITTCVEAGLGLDAALARVAERSTGPLADELSHMLRDVAMGKLRREALQEMADRVGVEELSTFVTAIIQAEQLGVSIAQVLRVQSDQMRTRRRQKAEQQAHEAPIKIMFPLVLFIFPAFLAVVLGPAGIRLADALL